jgi:hypothetical protein
MLEKDGDLYNCGNKGTESLNVPISIHQQNYTKNTGVYLQKGYVTNKGIENTYYTICEFKNTHGRKIP